MPYFGLSICTFLETFRTYDFDEQSLLCELFLHKKCVTMSAQNGSKCFLLYGRFVVASIPFVYEKPNRMASGHEISRNQ